MLSVSVVILAKNFPSWLHLRTNTIKIILTAPLKKKKNQTEKSFYKKTKYTDLKMGQCAELSQWKPLFFCPVRMSQMMMACGSSLVSIRGLKVTTYLEGIARTTEASDGHDSHQSLTCVLCLNGRFRQHSDRRRELGHN